MPEIDKLFINIETDAKGSYNAIGKFADNIGKVATALSGVNTSKMTTLASGIRQLGNSMSGMQSVGTADFTRLIKNVNRLNAIDTSNLSKVSASVRNIGKSLNGLTNVGKSAEQLSSLAKGISQLGYKSSTKAIENIPKLATAMKQFMATMSNAPKVSQNLIDMTNAMAKFARTGSSGGNAANSLAKSFNGYSSSTKTAKKHSFSLASAIGKVYATYWMLFRVMGKVKEAINISSDLTEVQNVVDTTFGNMAGKVEELADVSIEKFGMSELSLKQYASRFQAMGSAMSIDTSSIASANKYLNKQTESYVGLSNSMSDVSLTLTKLTADMASFYNMEQEDVAKDLESIFTGQTRPLRTYGLDLTEATLKEWALNNGMNANIKSMSQAEKTMLRYKYVLANTTNAQGDFERTANTWTNQTRILRQNLEQLASVVGGTLIGAFKPLIKTMNVVVGQITNFATIVSNAIGKIFGWTYEESGNAGVSQDFESAADSSQDIADSTGTAADNIKKMNAGLRAFDKLTVINTNKNSGSSSSGSGSSSSGASDGASSGKWTQGDSIIKSFESEIDTLYELGAKISSTLISTMEKIDWNSVYEKARGFGSGLANFLNGLFAGSNGTTLFGSLGKTIAGALNTAVQSALSFAKTFDFNQFGTNIADGINNFFDTFDFEASADSTNKWVKGIYESIITAISEIDWLDVYDKIIQYLSNLDIGTISMIISTISINEIKKVVLEKGLITWISDSLSKIIGGVPIILSNVKILAGGGLLKETKETGPITKLANALALAAGGASTLNEALTLAFGGVATTVAGIMLTVGGLLLSVTNFFSMLKDGFNWLKEILMIVGIAVAGVGAVVLGVPAGIAAAVAGAVAAIGTVVVVVKDNWDSIKKFFSDLWKKITDIWIIASTWFKDKVIEPVVSVFNGIKTRVQQVFEGLWIIIQAIWIIASTWFKNKVITPIVNFFSPIVKKIGDFFKNLWDGVKEVWKTVSKWFKDKVVTPVSDVFKKACDKIGGFFDGVWKGIKKGVVSAMNMVIAGIESGINFIVGGINGIISGFNKIVTVAAEIVGADWSGVTKIQEVTLKRISIDSYESGGFVTPNLPNKYSLIMAGEYGKAEMLGTVGGKTAVAGGKEITGISDTIRATSREEIALLKQQNALLQGILQKEFGITKDDIGKAASDWGKQQFRKNGNQVFTY